VSPPRLSVVVTVVDGGETLRRCLAALATQEDPPDLQVIVPFDDSVGYVGDLVAAFPGFQAYPLGPVATERPPESPAGQHELFDRRRAAGLAAATGRVVCLLEDRSVPAADWARTVDRLHSMPYLVIGGAVECGIDRMLNWAVYFCDFARYQLPLEAGPRDYVTDVNISYKREALEKTRALWEQRYHETTVNWALRRAGEVLYLSPDPVVRQHREGLSLNAILHERFVWGRLFAYTRARECTSVRRLAYAVLSPALPFLLFVRQARGQFSKRVRRLTFLRVAPVTFLLLASWSLGESVGYITGRA